MCSNTSRTTRQSWPACVRSSGPAARYASSSGDTSGVRFDGLHIGAYRRYRKESLRSVISDAGYVVEDLRYFDVAGLPAYWVAYRLLNIQRFGEASSAAFDRVLVPLSRFVQFVVKSPPLGKNLIAIASVGYD